MSRLDTVADLTRLTSHRDKWSTRAPAFAAFGIDLAVIVGATFAALYGRDHVDLFRVAPDVSDNVVVAGVPILALWLVSLVMGGAYAPHIFGAGSVEYKRVLRASGFAAGLIGIGCFLTRFPLSRAFYLMLFLIGVPALVLSRYAARTALRALRRRGHLQQTIVIVGAPAQVDEIAVVLQRERWLGYSVLGAVLPDRHMTDETPRGVHVLGSTSHAGAIVNAAECDVVLFVGGAVSSAQEMRRAVWELEESPVQILLAPSLTDVASDRIRPRPAAGLPLVELEGRAHEKSPYLKRAFDLITASLLLIVASPVLLAIALAIKLDDGGPVFFRQVRVGRQGRHFGVFKFRSMVVDAEARLAQLADLNKHADDHVLFKSEDDPRITRVGKILRRLSLDELPQLLNVLTGDMSLVGPRPPLQSEVDNYERDVHRRLAVRPGMTGLWQVSGRADLSWEDSVRLDLYYVDNWSLTQDLLIMLRTVHAVATSKGAY